MNIDNGSIVLWNDLTTEQKESGRWIKLGESEFATAADISANERPGRLLEILQKDFADMERKAFAGTDFRKFSDV